MNVDLLTSGLLSSACPLQSALMQDGQVVFCLTVSLDKLPVSTIKAKVRQTTYMYKQAYHMAYHHKPRVLNLYDAQLTFMFLLSHYIIH